MAHFQTHRNGLDTAKILQHVLHTRNVHRSSHPGSTDRSPCTQAAELNEYGLWRVVMPMHCHQFKLLTRPCYRGDGRNILTLSLIPLIFSIGSVVQGCSFTLRLAGVADASLEHPEAADDYPSLVVYR